MTKETENHFDNVAQNWDNNPVHQERTNAIANEIKKIFSNNKYSSGLEYGAGTGLLSIALKDYFSEIVLMDNSKEMINVNTAKLISMGINHLKPSYYDLESNDYSEKKFDVIFTQMTLHHIVDVEKIIQKFYNLLNVNGLLLIADLYKEDGTFHDRLFSGHLGFNPDELSKTIKETGFQHINFEKCFEITKGEKKYPIFLLSAKK